MKALSLVSLAALSLSACSNPPPMVPPPPEPPASTAVVESAPPPSVTPDAEFRKQPPTGGPAIVFVPPVIEDAKLSNGMRVLFVERHELPIVAVRLVSNRGAEIAAPGVGSFAGAVLTSGTKTRDALAISDAFEALGSDYGAGASFDDVSVSVKVLSSKLGEALTLLSDIVENPTFPKAEVEREKSQRLTEIGRQKDRPASLGYEFMSGLLYPARHPYHDTLLGTAEEVRKITSADLSLFYRSVFQPDAVTIAVSGDVKKETLMPLLEKAFGSWRGKAQKSSPPVLPPAWDGKGTKIFVLDRPGAAQSNVSVAVPGISRLDKDYEAVTVMNTILGGTFSSRLNLNLREKHAYTYGASSSFEMRQGPGPFQASSAIMSDSTAPAVHEMLTEIETMTTTPVSDEELANAKSAIVDTLPSRFETVSSTAARIGTLVAMGLPLDDYATQPARFAKVSKEDVMRVAARYLKGGSLRIVIVGDGAKIKDGLVGLKVGDVEVKTIPSSDAAKPAAQVAAPAAHPKKK